MELVPRSITYMYLLVDLPTCLMSGLCHFDRASNDEFSIEFRIFVIAMFFKVAKF